MSIEPDYTIDTPYKTVIDDLMRERDQLKTDVYQLAAEKRDLQAELHAAQQRAADRSAVATDLLLKLVALTGDAAKRLGMEGVQT